VERKLIKNPCLFFHERGGLHDSEVTSLRFNFANRDLHLSVDDLNANFLGLAEYSGLMPAKLVFKEIYNLNVNFDSNDISIFEVEAFPKGPNWNCIVKTSPGGSIGFDFESLEIVA
jgi:hypothetical protein